MATLTATGINTSNGTLDGFYTGSSQTNTSFPIGSYLQCIGNNNVALGTAALNSSVVPRIYFNGGQNNGYTANFAGGTVVSGTWRCRGGIGANCCSGYLPYAVMIQRTA